MKTSQNILWGAGAVLAMFAFAASAHAAIYMQYEGVEGETSAQASPPARATTTSTTRTSGSATITTGTGDTEDKGNVEYTWKVEEGEKGTTAPTNPTIQAPTAGNTQSGEKGGTEDINIGVGELQEGKVNKIESFTVKQGIRAGAYVAQYQESDWDFLSAKGDSAKGGISIAVGDVNGLTEEQKADLLTQKKEHAEVQSGQELELFAKGILLEDAAIEEVAFQYEKIKVKYRSSGKLFGFISLGFTEEVEVDTSAQASERIKVKLPWFAFLMQTDVSAEELETELGKNEKWFKGTDGKLFGLQAEISSSISNVLKTRHDTAKNSIGNIR